MFDVKKETERLTKQFIARLEALGALFNAEANVLAWKTVADKLSTDLGAIADGSLSWKDKNAPARQTKVTMPVAKPRTTFQSRVYGPKVNIEGPKPKERAKRFQELLGRRIGKWARRDGKVQYTMCDAKIFPDSRKAFYKMRRIDNGVEKWIKFTSIVRDWIYIQ